MAELTRPANNGRSSYAFVDKEERPMTRLTLTAAFAAIATTASAHPGHIVAANGHDHWALIGGIALAAIAGIPFALRLLRK